MVKSDWQTEINKIVPCYQRQDSLTEQMQDLYIVANKLGFYDGADYIREVFINAKTNSSTNW